MYIPCEASSWTLLHQNRKLSSRISLQNQLFCLCRLPVVLLSFFFGHCVVCPSIYEFWLHLWYLQTALLTLQLLCLYYRLYKKIQLAKYNTYYYFWLFFFCYEIISELNYLFTFNTIDRQEKRHRNVMFTTQSNLKIFLCQEDVMYFWMEHSITALRLSTNYKPFISTKMVSPCLRCIFLASW